MKHARLVIVLLTATVIAFAVMVFHVAFSLRDIDVYYSVYTDGEVEKVEKLLSSYKGGNLLFLSEKDVEKAITEKTSFKVKKVEKKYPDALVVELVARAEMFAVSDGEGGYYILDDEYSVVDRRTDYANKTDGLSGVLISFDISEPPVLREKGTLDTKNEYVSATVKCLAQIPELRDNVLEVKVEQYKVPSENGSGLFEDNVRVYVVMRSGVTIEVRKAFDSPEEKTRAGYRAYAQLSDEKKTNGFVLCLKKSDGEITADWSENSPSTGDNTKDA